MQKHMSSVATEEKNLVEDNEVEVVPEKQGPMADLLNAVTKRPSVDDVVEGPVVAIGRARVFIDLHPFGTGIIFLPQYLSLPLTL